MTKMKTQAIDWEKIVATHIPNEILMSRIYKMFLKIENTRKKYCQKIE